MTSNIERRLHQHNKRSSNTRTTKNLSDYELIFCQIVKGRSRARMLEKYLKSGIGREIRSEIVKYIS